MKKIALFALVTVLLFMGCRSSSPEFDSSNEAIATEAKNILSSEYYFPDGQAKRLSGLRDAYVRNVLEEARRELNSYTASGDEQRLQKAQCLIENAKKISDATYISPNSLGSEPEINFQQGVKHVNFDWQWPATNYWVYINPDDPNNRFNNDSKTTVFSDFLIYGSISVIGSPIFLPLLVVISSTCASFDVIYSFLSWDTEPGDPAFIPLSPIDQSLKIKLAAFDSQILGAQSSQFSSENSQLNNTTGELGTGNGSSTFELVMTYTVEALGELENAFRGTILLDIPEIIHPTEKSVWSPSTWFSSDSESVYSLWAKACSFVDRHYSTFSGREIFDVYDHVSVDGKNSAIIRLRKIYEVGPDSLKKESVGFINFKLKDFEMPGVHLQIRQVLDTSVQNNESFQEAPESAVQDPLLEGYKYLGGEKN
ncbi:MAG: hypothetical protein HYS98_03125 [Deltaproteobacteria bacterium]|nr:hypothetical protein [Deltaproteobacteria bacterium]